ncbi:MAG: alternative ribosome rescue aminoacyl-tRNA hydrolase ArfB [Planctomycetota bacterium]|nr:alternative ribosome rescue aminoacyl-tRNA hydrolase ArfB [Planctomycetota bacterium]
MLTVNDQIQIPHSEFDFTYSRSGGPGGQNVNKVNTKVTLHWQVDVTPSLTDAVRGRFQAEYRRRITKDGALVMHSQRYRDQARNVEDCLSKLQALILEIVDPPKPRVPTRPSRGSKLRRLNNKRKQSEKKYRRRKPSADES